MRAMQGRWALVLAATCALSLWVAASAVGAPTRLWQRCDGATAGDVSCSFPRGIASAPAGSPHAGDVYVVDEKNSRVLEYTAWGEFLRSFGSPGEGRGQFDAPPASGAQGVAVDSAGNVYVGDAGEHRVQKFSPEGNFILMFGGQVNRTAVEEARPEAERNLCPAPGHPTDVCQAGTTGTGKGQFGAQPFGSYLAIGSSSRAYVGDVGRIQVFNPDGSYREDLPDPKSLLTGRTVQALASEKSGNLFVSFKEGEGVLKLSPAGAELCSAKVKTPLALAADGAGNLYVVDGEKNAGVEMEIRKFAAAGCSGAIGEDEGSEFPFHEGLETSTGIATGSACFEKPNKESDLYITHFPMSFVRAYGPPPNKLSLCPRPPRPPAIVAQYALSVGVREATVQAEINPRFWPNTSYWVQYATAACIKAGGWEADSCVKERPAEPGVVLGPEIDAAIKTAAVLLDGLEAGTEYRFRFAAQSRLEAGTEVNPEGGPVSGEGGAPGEDGKEGAFRTATPLLPPPADTCPNRALRTGAAARLLDCRAYEMVSPVDKEGSDIRSGSIPDGLPAARDQSDLSGDKLAYTAEKRFGDAISQPSNPQYIASRGSEGWRTHGISPPRGVVSGGGPLEGSDNEFKAFSPDLCRAWLVTDRTTAPPLAPGGITGENNLYERSNCGTEGYRTLSPSQVVLQGMTADSAEVMFQNPEGVWLLNDEGAKTAACVLPAGTPPPGCSAGTTLSSIGSYEASLEHAISIDGGRIFWTASAVGPGRIFVRENPTSPPSALAHGAAKGSGKLAAGSTVVSEVATSSGAFEVGQTIIAARGIPAGTTIESVNTGEAKLVLSAPANENRSGEPLEAFSQCTEAAKACTVAISDAVSATQPAEETTRRSTFLGAAPDGSAALFSFDPDKGEGPAKPDLYEFETTGGISHPIAHNVLGVLGTSENLSRIYLVSQDALNGEADGEEAGGPNLYLYEAGAGGGFTFIAILASADANPNPRAPNPFPTSPVPVNHTARISPSGGVAVFVSTAPLTGYDNRDAASGEADTEVFRYEAMTGELACVSCEPSGARPSGQLVDTLSPHFEPYWAAAQIPGAEHSLYFSRALSANGSRLFFESFVPLVPSDTNRKKDVYEWEAPGEGSCSASSLSFSPLAQGCVSLISSGENGQDSSFVDATPNGSDVFFSTGENLVPQDPGLIDIYDARVGGGFPPPPAPQPPCEGEACQGPPSPPAALTPGSAAFKGPGNLPRKRKAKHHKHRRRTHRHRGHKRAAR
jgi:hypothetical protein